MIFSWIVCYHHGNYRFDPISGEGIVQNKCSKVTELDSCHRFILLVGKNDFFLSRAKFQIRSNRMSAAVQITQNNCY